MVIDKLDTQMNYRTNFRHQANPSTLSLGIEKHGEDFKKLLVNKPVVGEQDVKFELKYCGICHTDVHYALNELSNVSSKLPKKSYA